MKLNILLFAFIFSSFLLGQEKVQIIRHGVLTMKNNEKIEFTNLKYEDDKIIFTNIKNQQEEHLFLDSILSIDEGKVELIDASEVNLIIESHGLVDGLYLTFDNLVNKKPQSGSFNIQIKNKNRNLYFIEDANGKKLKKAFVVIQDGNLYVRGKAMKEFQDKRVWSFNGNKKHFIKLTYTNDNQFSGKASFNNSAVSLTGAIFAGVAAGTLAPGIGSAIVFAGAGSSLISLAANSKKQIILNLDDKKILIK